MKEVLRNTVDDPKLRASWSRQLASAREIRKRHEQGIMTVLLADEVGMGKTYVALATIALHLGESEENDRKVLLVVPSALLGAKWEQEIGSFNKRYVDISRGGKPLRPVVVRGYWDLVRNLHDYKDDKVPYINDNMLKHFAMSAWKWRVSRKAAGKHKEKWGMLEGCHELDTGYLDFCSRFSSVALATFLDERASKDPGEFERMGKELRGGKTPAYLKTLFRDFGRGQDAAEPNVFIVSMGNLARTYANNPDARLLYTYLAARAVGGRREATKNAVLEELMRANLARIPGPDIDKGKEWFRNLGTINLWGLQGEADSCLSEGVRREIVEGRGGSSAKQVLVPLGEEVIRKKMEHANFILAVVDEVHNWKGGANGAAEFKKNYSRYVDCKLLMSATPFQLDQDELGRVFDFAVKDGDAAGPIVKELLREGGDAQQCLRLSGRFEVAWRNLTADDMRHIEHALGRGDSPEAALRQMERESGDPGGRRAGFASAFLDYQRSVGDLRAKLSRVVIRHTKPRRHRHFHAGAEYALAGKPDYSVPRQALYGVAGYGDEHGLLLSYLGMRAEQRVRHDADASGKAQSARLLNGFSSSLEAFRESNLQLLGSKQFSGMTRAYLSLFESVLCHSEHPKVRATVQRAADNYRRGIKTLIFCERLATQGEIVSNLENALREFGGSGKDTIERKSVLREHGLVELFLSRSIIAAGKAQEPQADQAKTALERADSLIRDVESRRGALSERQRRKLVDLSFFAEIVSHRPWLEGIRSLLNSSEGLDWYLNPTQGKRGESIDDDDLDDGERQERGADAIDQMMSDIMSGESIWHLGDASRELHECLWRLLESELEQLAEGVTTASDSRTADGTAVADLLIDLGQGLRRIILRRDVLARTDRRKGQTMAQAVITQLRADQGRPGTSSWSRAVEFVKLLSESQGSLRRRQVRPSKRGSLWQGVFLKEQEIVQVLRGDVKLDTRNRRCAAFNSPLLPDILVCTAIGSEGIDLHLYCDEVIHHDLPWNPARLEQRIGRLDRVGSLTERLPADDGSPRHLDIGIPFLASDYDEFQYLTLLARAQRFEILLGRPEFSVAVDERIEDEEAPQTEPADDNAPEEIAIAPLTVALPEQLLELIRVDLSL